MNIKKNPTQNRSMERKSTKYIIKNLTILFIFIFATTLFCGCGQQQMSINVDGIEISKKNIYLAEGQTAVISAQVYPFNATNQNYEFESSDENIVTIQDGFVVAKNAGDAIIYVYSEDGGYQDTCNVLVTTARNNLALNSYNNLNMPPKDLEPIYNSDDYTDEEETDKYNTNQTSQQVAQKNTKKLSTKNISKTNGIPKSKSKRYTVKNMANNKSTNNKQTAQNTSNKKVPKPIKNTGKKSFRDVANEIAQKVNAEVTDEVEAGKNVLDNLKKELQNSIDSLEQEKEIIANSMATFAQNSFVNSFNNIQCEMIDMFKNVKQDMLNSITETKEKLEDGDYTVESKNINGVTFVVISNNVEKEQNL